MRKSRKQQKTLRRLNYDLFGEKRGTAGEAHGHVGRKGGGSGKEKPLPPIEELYRLYDIFNMIHFKGKLPRVRIEYSARMLIAGSYTPTLKVIKMGKKYHEIFRDEIEDTLLHEMIHIVYPNHDARFKAVAHRLGVSLRAKAHPDLRAPYKYLYVCPLCGKEYPRRKRYRMASCGICSRGAGFDPHCKLVLTDTKAKKKG
jgi:predicted SprT family Zn-dependent metalloprotease